MFLCRGRRIVARHLMRMPRLYSIGICTKKVERRTCTGVPIVDAGTKPPPPSGGRVVGMSMSILNGWVPSISLVDALLVVIVKVELRCFVGRLTRTVCTRPYVLGCTSAI